MAKAEARQLAALVTLFAALLLPAAGHGQADLRVLDAMASSTVRLPSDGVRGLLWSGDELLLLVTSNRSLSAPASSFAANLVRLDTVTGVADTLSREVDGYESGLTSDGEFLWSGGSLLGSQQGLYQLDRKTFAISLTLPGSGYHPAGLAWDGSYLWQVDADSRKLLRMDVEEGRISRKIAAPGFYPTGLAYDGFHFWCADAATGRLYRLRSHDGRADAVINAEAFMRPGEFVSLTWDGRALWAAAASDSFAVRLELLQ